MSKELVNDYMQKSLVFERAWYMVNTVMRSIGAERKENTKEAARNGELPDESYNIVLADLRRIKKEYRKKSEELWNKAKQISGVDDSVYDRLANAVIERAAIDYEIAISAGNAGRMAELESFARSDYADDLTKCDVPAILQKIRYAWPGWKAYVTENAEDIAADTIELRRKRTSNIEAKFKYRCPFCGGGLNMYSRAVKNEGRRFVCSGCAFFLTI